MCLPRWYLAATTSRMGATHRPPQMVFAGTGGLSWKNIGKKMWNRKFFNKKTVVSVNQDEVCQDGLLWFASASLGLYPRRGNWGLSQVGCGARAGKLTESTESGRMALCLCTAIQSMCNHPFQLSHLQCSEWSLQPASALAFRNSDDRVHVRPNWVKEIGLWTSLTPWFSLYVVNFVSFAKQFVHTSWQSTRGSTTPWSSSIAQAENTHRNIPYGPYTSSCHSLKVRQKSCNLEVTIASVSTPTRPWTLHMAHPLWMFLDTIYNSWCSFWFLCMFWCVNQLKVRDRFSACWPSINDKPQHTKTIPTPIPALPALPL